VVSHVRLSVEEWGVARSYDVVVIGAGAAGMLAAARAAQRGRRVLLLEKNRKPGVKILMSGGTRCNLTQATDARGILAAFGPSGRFLRPALAALGPDDLVRLVERQGVTTKVESTGKVFPASDRALDVQQALLRLASQSGAELSLGEPAVAIASGANRFEIATPRRRIPVGRLVLTTGGQSYPGCGTTGDAYRWLADCGHDIVPLRPALVPLTIRADWAKALRGITVPDVEIRLRPRDQARRPPSARGRWGPGPERGSLLLAHFGLSGPAILNVSRHVSAHPQPRQLTLQCDFLPGMTTEALRQWFQERAARDGRRQVAVLLGELLPRRLAESLSVRAGIPPGGRAAELSRLQRAALTEQLKANPVPVTGTLGFEKAEVTAGGLSLAEVNPRTMESRRVAGLYVAGEVLDLDGPIGGYNFQAAFSTGWLAGESV
jgi:predicted Rossmann fold flavoprotein